MQRVGQWVGPWNDHRCKGDDESQWVGLGVMGLSLKGGLWTLKRKSINN